MKALIIGAAGFVGPFLIEHIKYVYNWEVHATKLSNEVLDVKGVYVHDLNILDSLEIGKLLNQVKPDYIFCLAAQSSVEFSWKNPELTVDINIKGTLNILENIRMIPEYHPKVLLIGSGEEYGYLRTDEIPVHEDTVLRPGNIYAVTKACQNMFANVYARAYDMHLIMVRAFNHIGPKQASTFVVSNFCKQVAEIEAGLKPPVLYVGNLSAKRDFTDVRDIVRAYGLLIQNGNKGETYNIGRGQAISIEDILKQILLLTDVNIICKEELSRIRPTDVPIIEADVTKLQNTICWKPEIGLETTLLDTLNYWRKKLRQ